MPVLHERIDDPGSPVEEHLFVEEDGTCRLITVERKIDRLMEAARHVPEVAPTKDLRYNGSIPPVIALRWMRECGAGVGTAEFAAYAKRELTQGEFSKLLIRRF